MTHLSPSTIARLAYFHSRRAALSFAGRECAKDVIRHAVHAVHNPDPGEVAFAREQWARFARIYLRN